MRLNEKKDAGVCEAKFDGAGLASGGSIGISNQN